MKLRRRQVALFSLHVATFWLVALSLASPRLNAEPLGIAYTSIAMVYGPLWLTQEAGHFEKYNIEPGFVDITGGFVDGPYKKR